MIADDQSIGSATECHSRIFDVLNTFQNQLAAPKFFNPGNVIPIQARVKLRGGPLAEFAHIADTLHVANDITKLAIFSTKHPHRPAWLGSNIDQICQSHLGRGA